MDIVRFCGGLGNQMFQYAFLRSLQSRGRSVKAYLGFYTKHPDLRPFCLTDVFEGINLDVVSQEDFDIIDERWKKIKEDKSKLKSFIDNTHDRFFWVEEISGVYIPEVYMTANCVFAGYWQTEKYFRKIEQKLKKEFTFSKITEELYRYGEMCSDCVGLHVRRGDYLDCPGLYGGVCTQPYYDKALDYIMERDDIKRIIVFSDDEEWAQNNINYAAATFCSKDDFEHHEDWYDMYLMSKCKHIIIANSSFSWWGAWLNRNPEKIVICPETWSMAVNMKDIQPTEWIKIRG